MKKTENEIKLSKKNVFITIVFLSISFIIGALTMTVNFKPILKGIYREAVPYGNDETKLTTKIVKAIASSNSVLSKNIFGLEHFVEIYGGTQKLLNKKIIVDSDIGHIIKDEQGFLHFPVYAYNVKPNAEKAVEMKKYFDEIDIPFSFLLAMPKDYEDYTTFKKGIEIYMNSTKYCDDFTSVLQEGNVDFMDMRKVAKETNLDIANTFFKTDHHWKTETAFWAFKEIVRYIDENYGVNLDQDNFKTDISNYDISVLENSFNGSLGKRMGKLYSGIDDYSIITPKYETNLKLYRGFDKILVNEGSFSDILIDKELSKPDAPITTNRYASYFGRDDDFTTVINENASNDYKILIIKDSFALPVSAFLSTVCKEVTMVDFRASRDQSVKEFIKNNDYDLVLMLYSSNTVSSDNMFDFK